MSDPLNAQWKRLDEKPAASAQMIEWHAPETAAALRHALWVATVEARLRERLAKEILALDPDSQHVQAAARIARGEH